MKINRVPEAAASSTMRWRNSLLSLLNAGVPKPKILMSGSMVSWLRKSRKSLRSQTARPHRHLADRRRTEDHHQLALTHGWDASVTEPGRRIVRV